METKPADEMTLAEVVAQLKTILPVIQEMQNVLSALKEDDGSMETPACVDELNKTVAEQGNKIAAQDAEITALKSVKGLDVKDVFAVASKREHIYNIVSPVLGTFDASGMDARDVAVYAAEKFGLSVAPEHAEIAVNAYMAAKPTVQQKSAFSLDSLTGSSPIAAAVEV